MLADAVRLVVGMADLQVSADARAELVSYALGSCLGVAVHDPVARVGGLLHVMLPESSIDPGRAAAQPAMFVDTGVPLLFRSCYRLGARKERMVLKVAGGALSASGAADTFHIGARNMVMLRRLLERNGVLIQGQDTGGTGSRTVVLRIGSGDVIVSGPGHTVAL